MTDQQLARALYPILMETDLDLVRLLAAVSQRYRRPRQRHIDPNGPVVVRYEAPGPTNQRIKFPPAEGHVERSLERQADRILASDKRHAVRRSRQEARTRQKPAP